MQIVSKTFQELSTKELYDLLQLRNEVFIVEQECAYQDLDGKDEKALHVLGYKNNKLVAYTRCFKPGDYFEYASIGRVVVHQEARQHKFGYHIMEASIEVIKNHFKETTIKLSAQTYLIKFYKNIGFKEVGVEYHEDGIPHIAMIKS